MKNPSETERSSLVQDLIEDVLPLMGISGSVVVAETGETITANISGEDLSLLIGGKGKAIDSLQYLANVVANRNDDTWIRVIVDADGYRERRKESLEQCAASTADQAIAEAKEIALEPMNAFERRIVHCALADRPDVITDSRGEEPYRHVIVAPAHAGLE